MRTWEIVVVKDGDVIVRIADLKKLTDFVKSTAGTGYDGKDCSHTDHDATEDCEPWDMPNDETHDNLVGVVQSAEELVKELKL